MAKLIGEGLVNKGENNEIRIKLCKDSRFTPFWNALQNEFDALKSQDLIEPYILKEPESEQLYDWFRDCAERDYDMSVAVFRKYLSAVRKAAPLLKGLPVLVHEYTKEHKQFMTYETKLTGEVLNHSCSSASLYGLAAEVDNIPVQYKKSKLFVHFFDIIPERGDMMVTIVEFIL